MILQYIFTCTFFYSKKCVECTAVKLVDRLLSEHFSCAVQGTPPPGGSWSCSDEILLLPMNQSEVRPSDRNISNISIAQISAISCAECFWKEDEWGLYQLNFSFDLILEYPSNCWMETGVKEQRIRITVGEHNI